jgi:DNA (cytosine-5)-methyltransferase 1
VNFLDLFAGIGGFALGVYWSGMRFENHFCSEIDPYEVELYAKRFPDSVQLGDITKIDFEKLKNDYPGEWIIAGGFPCQDISIAGKGAGIEGKRSGLWFEMWRAIRILRPRFVIAENVGAITFRGLDQVLSSLAEIGYDAEWQDIRAADVGAPHRRERIWIVAYPMSTRKRGDKWESKIKKDVISDSDCKRLNRQSISIWKKQKEDSKIDRCSEDIPNSQCIDDDNTGHGTGEIQRERSAQAKIQRNKWWKFEPGMGRLAHGVSRKMDRLRGLGNSIVPQIAEIIFRKIKKVLDFI